MNGYNAKETCLSAKNGIAGSDRPRKRPEKMRRVMKKKTAVLTAAVLLAAVLASGCSGSSGKAWDGSENSIYVADDKSVQSAMVYTSEKENDLYSEEGLTDFVKEQVISYNKEQGAVGAAENTKGQEKLPVALERSSLEGTTGNLIFSYGTPEDFVIFSEENGDDTHTVTSLSVLDAQSASLPELSYKTTTGKDVDTQTAAAKDSRAVILEGSALVYTEGKILYVSDGVKLRSEHSAVTPEGTSCIIFK